MWLVATDDEDVFHCYRHPNRETALRCANCDRPICVDCGIAAPVGIKCRECGRMPKSARVATPRGRLLIASLVAIALVPVIGIASDVVARGIGFFGWLIAYGIGILVAEVVVRAAGGFRSDAIARIAAATAVAGYLAPVILVLLSGDHIGNGIVYRLVAAGFAGWSAFQRAR